MVSYLKMFFSSGQIRHKPYCAVIWRVFSKSPRYTVPQRKRYRFMLIRCGYFVPLSSPLYISLSRESKTAVNETASQRRLILVLKAVGWQLYSTPEESPICCVHGYVCETFLVSSVHSGTLLRVSSRAPSTQCAKLTILTDPSILSRLEPLQYTRNLILFTRFISTFAGGKIGGGTTFCQSRIKMETQRKGGERGLWNNGETRPWWVTCIRHIWFAMIVCLSLLVFWINQYGNLPKISLVHVPEFSSTCSIIRKDGS